MIPNMNRNFPSKKSENHSDYNPWTVTAAIFLIGATGMVFAALSSVAIAVWLALLTIELYRKETWVRGFILLSALPVSGLIAITIAFGTLRFAIVAIPFLISAILLQLPPPRKWFDKTSTKENATHISRWSKILRLSYRAVIVSPIAVLLPGMIAFTPSIPGIIKFSRLSGYQTKNALLAAEPCEVKKTVEFIQNGTNFTAIFLSPIGLLPSGPPIIIYDANGRRVDCCRDSGDNLRFLKQWRLPPRKDTSVSPTAEN